MLHDELRCKSAPMIQINIRENGDPTMLRSLPDHSFTACLQRMPLILFAIGPAA
jgi:hypothetical protein